MSRMHIFSAALALFSLGVQADPGDRQGIEQAALDYIQGWYAGDAARMADALDDDLAKRKVSRVSRDGRTAIENSGKEELVEATSKGWGRRTPQAKQLQSVTVLDAHQDIASVRVETGEFVDYLHLARHGGRWRIVNVMWQPKLE